MKPLLWAVLATLPLRAQYFNPATDETGEIVYFSDFQRLYALSNGAIRRLDQRDTHLSPDTYPRVSLSKAGDTLAINRNEICVPFLCPAHYISSSTIQSPNRTLTVDGAASLSPNGRFAAVFNLVSPGVVSRLDMASGLVQPMGLQPARDGQFVSDNGSILIAKDNALNLITPTRTITLHNTRPLRRALLNFDATAIVYDVDRAPFEIHLIDTERNTDTVLGPGTLPMMSSDGRTIAYLNNQKIQILNLATRDTRILSTSESITDHALSGNAAKAIAITESGRLISIDLQTGQEQILLTAPFPRAYLRTAMVPGSYNELLGAFPADFRPTLKLGALEPILLGRTRGGFAFQVPWEAPIDAQVVLTIDAGPNPWPSNAALTGVQPPSGLIFAPLRNPARRGETVELYGAGYGPVDGKVPTGQPTPTDRLYRLASNCQWQAKTEQGVTRSFEVPFAGLAPGLIGIYQLNIQIPNDWPDSTITPVCQFPDARTLKTLTIPIQP